MYGEKDSEVRRILDRVRCPSPRRLEELLSQCRVQTPGLADIAELLEIGADPTATEQFELLRSFVREQWSSPEGSRVRYVAPIYVSSFCIDSCPYCNFSASRKETARHRLTLDELDAEIDAVIGRDARVIELVYATDPECDQATLAKHVARAVAAIEGRPGSGVLLCTEYLSDRAYDALREAGLIGIVQWDETLDEDAYRRWHAASPRKRDFCSRIDNHDRALAAGLEVATGALLGLAGFRYDALMQVAKARYFAEEYGRGPFVMGTARLQPIAGRELRVPSQVSDRAYETVLMAYKIAVPDAGRWLQTRETFDMNLRNLLDRDVFTYRCGEVRPGGYCLAPSASPVGQFGVNELERSFVERELAKRGFQIDYEWIPASMNVRVNPVNSAPIRVGETRAENRA
ncbi:MAG: radical SAM protein [Bryobacteraceae bacterium]